MQRGLVGAFRDDGIFCIFIVNTGYKTAYISGFIKLYT